MTSLSQQKSQGQKIKETVPQIDCISSMRKSKGFPPLHFIMWKYRAPSERETVSHSVCPTFCDPMDCSPLGSAAHGILQSKDTGVDCHSLQQGIFPTQGSNLGLQYCRQILYHLSYQGSHAVIGPKSEY